ncbi:alpha/beta fold hydrolase [Acinetobacter sp. ANC 5378]|uniref:alpha/beta fold hydrolase n=1 Tax=Acinetobacter sp. ANC 5378 TaxID=2731249 RepID=UPI0014906428|nr:alpha/beta fold hydrolase [Acinetobacter sp. ANC 5378]NNG83252.1 alpha/beta fold hydrolase [Acinetobacter sp. ANC 5378]
MILNHQMYLNENPTEKTPLVFIHGLFGSLSNLGMLARAYYESHSVIQIDVRNHGHSAHSLEMNYAVMAQDILETLDDLNIQKFSVIGHSMGGKIAMQLANSAGERLEQLVVLDMAPFAYQESHHDQIFKALFAVQNAQIESRQQAMQIMREYLREEMVIQFLMKSFNKGQWLFNVEALFNHYPDIIDWDVIQPWQKEALFIRGGKSAYISKDEHFAAIQQQFPHARIIVIEDAGHWLHAEKTQQVIDEMNKYLH